MDETKRVNGQYIIKATNVIIDGDLILLGGGGTTVDFTTVNIEDNVIFLNYGEIGAGVVLGTSGIEIDRGSLPNANLIWKESTDAFEVRLGDGAGGALANLRAADPVDDTDVATKGWALANVTTTPAGSTTEIQFNNAGAFGGSANLTWSGTILKVGNFDIGSNIIASTNVNGGIELTTNGTGQIYLRAPLRLENEGSDPSSIAGSNMVYAKTPSTGGTGLFINNTSTSGELVSKSRAIFYSMIF